MIIRNDDSADSLNLYPATGDTLNSLAANTAISVAAGFTAICRRVTNTRWLVNIVDVGAILMALSALGTGLVAKTGVNTFAVRTLTAPAAGVTVSNGDGVSGNPTLALANDLAALEAMASTGLVARTAAETYAQRTLTAPAAGITVTDGNGVAGNPTLVLANDLAALEALASTGLAARTGADAWAQRTITGPAAGITVSNGSGAGGNPTLALANDLAALEGLSGTGLVARTASETFVERTLTAPAAGITVSNGSGAAGNPTLALANDLSALEALASTGIAVRSASDTWVQRSIAGTSLFTTVTNGDGVSGDPTITIADEFKTGWVSAGETWTRTSNTTFTISGDLTGKYRKGHKIRWKDGGSYEYAYIEIVSHAAGTTTVTLNAGTDYAMAAATITENYYSAAELPFGFPVFFNYTPTATGFSVAPGVTTCHFTLSGGRLWYHYRGTSGTSNATTFTLTAPMASHASAGSTAALTQYADDNGVALTAPSVAGITQGSSTVTLTSTYAGGAWTAANGKRAGFLLSYPF